MSLIGTDNKHLIDAKFILIKALSLARRKRERENEKFMSRNVIITHQISQRVSTYEYIACTAGLDQ